MNAHPTLNEQSITIHVRGDLISTNAEAVRNEANGLLGTADGPSRQWTALILDLTTAQMVDSVGLNLIVTLLKRVQQCGAKMRIVYTSPNVMRTFAFTRLDKHVEMVKA